MNAIGIISALRAVVAPGSTHLDVRLSRADIVALLGHLDGWQAQHGRDSVELRRLCAERDRLRAAQRRQPLTEMEAIDLMPTSIPARYDADLLWYCRAVERAHRIQGETE